MRYLKGIIGIIIATIISILLQSVLIIVGDRKIISLVFMIIITGGWCYAFKKENEENIDGVSQKSKFKNSYNNRTQNIGAKDLIIGMPFVTIFSLIFVYLEQLIIISNVIRKEYKISFFQALTENLDKVFQFSSEIKQSMILVIAAGILVIIMAFFVLKNEKKQNNLR